jgi:hypothetical protein
MSVHSLPASDALADLVASANPKAIDAVAGALESGDLTLSTSAVGLKRRRGVDQRHAELFARAFSELEPTQTPAGVALALRTASRVLGLDAATRPQVEVVWTGPEAGGPLVRPTAATIKEMLGETRAGGEVLIVGYSLTADSGSPSAEVIDLLGGASHQQVQIRFVLHKDEEAKNRRCLLDAWHKFAIKPSIYTWEPEAGGGPYRKMHAKVLVVDRLDVLVTSANLTYHGLSENLEIGLRVRGPQAMAIAQRFDHLIAEGVLREWRD